MSHKATSRQFFRRRNRQRTMTRFLYGIPSQGETCKPVDPIAELDEFAAGLRDFVESQGESYDTLLSEAVARTYPETPLSRGDLSDSEVAEIVDDIKRSLPRMG